MPTSTVQQSRAGTSALIAVSLGALMPGLVTTILAVANAAIATDLHASVRNFQAMPSSMAAERIARSLRGSSS